MMKRLLTCLFICLCAFAPKTDAAGFYETPMTAENADGLIEEAFMAFMDDRPESLSHLKLFFALNEGVIAGYADDEATFTPRVRTCSGLMFYWQALNGAQTLPMGVEWLNNALPDDPWAGILLARLKWDAFIQAKAYSEQTLELLSAQEKRLTSAMELLERACTLAKTKNQMHAADYALAGMIDLLHKNMHFESYISVPLKPFAEVDAAFMTRATKKIYMAKVIACAYNQGIAGFEKNDHEVKKWTFIYYGL